MCLDFPTHCKRACIYLKPPYDLVDAHCTSQIAVLNTQKTGSHFQLVGEFLEYEVDHDNMLCL
jgi:hypothetical protein